MGLKLHDRIAPYSGRRVVARITDNAALPAGSASDRGPVAVRDRDRDGHNAGSPPC